MKRYKIGPPEDMNKRPESYEDLMQRAKDGEWVRYSAVKKIVRAQCARAHGFFGAEYKAQPREKKDTDDYDRMMQVAELAKTAVWKVLLAGQGKDRSIEDNRILEHHLMKAVNHLEMIDAPIAPSYKTENIERLTGALTRIAIVLYLMDAHSDSKRGDKE